MDWSNFLKLTKENPDLGAYIRQHIGPPRMHSMDWSEESERKRRKYLESKVAYIAFRPIESLNLEDADFRNTAPIHPDIRPTNCRLPSWIQEETQYIHTIYYHINDEEAPFSRVVWIDDRGWWADIPSGRHGRTIRKCIEGFIGWHERYWTQRDRFLVLDCLVKTTKIWNDLDEAVGIEWHEIYRFPLDFVSSLTKQAA